MSMSLLSSLTPPTPSPLSMATPLLSDYQNPNIEDQAIKQVKESQKQIDELETRACCRGTAAKIAGFGCLPCSTLGACCNEVVPRVCGDTPEHELDVPSGIPRSNWTKCDGGCCWKPQSFPENKVRLFGKAIFDPLCCLTGCGREHADHFLVPEERELRNRAINVVYADLKKSSPIFYGDIMDIVDGYLGDYAPVAPKQVTQYIPRSVGWTMGMSMDGDVIVPA